LWSTRSIARTGASAVSVMFLLAAFVIWDCRQILDLTPWEI
jgi:hypothetical protein